MHDSEQQKPHRVSLIALPGRREGKDLIVVCIDDFIRLPASYPDSFFFPSSSSQQSLDARDIPPRIK